MIIRSLESIEGTERDVVAESGVWRSRRFILAKDGVGFSLNMTTVNSGTEVELWYKHHIEAVMCLEGECELTNKETGEVFTIKEGDMYVLDKHERHIVRTKTFFRAIAVFNPPLTGREDHDADGSFPLLVDAD
ncbi:ectoine synthase [Burkholderia ubonensis]|uniref:L-ectoine synthase n=1 Tax=Burkholderia ubonensis subsp. mesacidophila TaxID=265293 RepID=A0A2A4FLZ2_9BURK|nr:ectoine synthase [Burkholderia ubonensis]PCE33692.1 L-ectoine synthase [Burkholderia ubonensis subsp. mesacidophila]